MDGVRPTRTLQHRPSALQAPLHAPASPNHSRAVTSHGNPTSALPAKPILAVIGTPCREPAAHLSVSFPPWPSQLSEGQMVRGDPIRLALTDTRLLGEVRPCLDRLPDPHQDLRRCADPKAVGDY